MRVFVVLCLVAVAYADKLGYDYQPVGHSDAGLSFTPGGAGDVGGIEGGAPSSGFANLSPSYAAPAAEFNKEYFTYTAPDHEFDDAQGAHDAANSLKKNLRVVFIKGPENRGLENAVVNLAKQAADQRTAIYVLQKQSDIGDLANKLNAVRNNNNNRPEVHFVKYRTPQDAANAQHAIQSQYDQLGGTSQSHNGGVAPVHNFASQAPVRAPVAHAPGNAYLPSSVFRYRL